MSYSPSIAEQLQELHQDALSWKAAKLWEAATDPDSQANAIDELVETILCIGNEVKQSTYIDQIQKQLKIKNSLLRKQVKAAADRIEQKKQAEIARKKLEAQYSNAEEAGLANGYKGNIFDALKYGIYEHDGVYYARSTKPGGADYPVSNFTMKILYHVNTSDEQAFRLIAVKNVYGFESFINMNTDDFVSLGSFRKVLARRGDYVWKGTDSDLSRLQEFLQRDEVSTVYIKTLGWQPRGRFYAFANGIVPLKKDSEPDEFIPIDPYGIIPHGTKNYFIPAVSKMYEDKDDVFVNEKKFVYKKPVPKFGFQEWATLFFTAYGSKGICAILFYLGSIYRDIIIAKLQRYPLLNLFGPPGAGKGTLAESLMSLFGDRQDQIMLGGASTVVGFMRKFAQFRNAIVWLDEYKNTLPAKFIESLKNIYDGKGYERGKMTNDFQTESTPIHSSAILSGQDMPTIEPALFMRVILLSFEEGKDRTKEQRVAFQELREREDTGISYITAQLVQYREMVEENFKERYQIIFKQLVKEIANVEVDDRMIMNISMLLTFYDLFKEKIVFPFSFQEAKAFMISNMEAQHGILAGNNDLAKFWGVVETLFYQDLVREGHDFVLEDGYIYLRLQQVHPLYMKELKQRGDPNYLAKPTLEHYLSLDKTIFIDHIRKRFPDGSNSWTYKLKYNKVGVDLIRIKGEGMSADQRNSHLASKYGEMGIEIDPTKQEGEKGSSSLWQAVTTETPFP